MSSNKATALIRRIRHMPHGNLVVFVRTRLLETNVHRLLYPNERSRVRFTDVAPAGGSSPVWQDTEGDGGEH